MRRVTSDKIIGLAQEGIKRLESIVHPLVAAHRHRFLTSIAEQPDQQLVVLDIPLLFETQGEDQVSRQSCLMLCSIGYFGMWACYMLVDHSCDLMQTDSIAVVSAPEEVQRARVLARPNMTQGRSPWPMASLAGINLYGNAKRLTCAWLAAKFQAIVKRQVPDEVKRGRADFIIDTVSVHQEALQPFSHTSGNPPAGKLSHLIYRIASQLAVTLKLVHAVCLRGKNGATSCQHHFQAAASIDFGRLDWLCWCKANVSSNCRRAQKLPPMLPFAASQEAYAWLFYLGSQHLLLLASI